MTTTDPRPEFPEMRRRFGTPTPEPVETIDHKAEAVRLIADAKSAHASAQTHLVALAQAEATLALADQQRITNLIMVAQQRSSEEQLCKRTGATFLDHDGNVISPDEMHDRTYVVADMVREGLGLA